MMFLLSIAFGEASEFSWPSEVVTGEAVLISIFSIWRVSACAKEKITITIMNKTTTRFLSDNIALLIK